MAHYCRLIPKEQVRSTAQRLSTDIQYQTVSDSQMQMAMNKRLSAGQNERDIYASYLLEAFLCELEKEPQPIMFQFSFGAEPLPYETTSRLNQNSIAELAHIIARHPLIKFQRFFPSRHANQSLLQITPEKLLNLNDQSKYMSHSKHP